MPGKIASRSREPIQAGGMHELESRYTQLGSQVIDGDEENVGRIGRLRLARKGEEGEDENEGAHRGLGFGVWGLGLSYQ